MQQLSTKDKGVFLSEGYGAISYSYGSSARPPNLAREKYDPNLVNIPLPTDATRRILPVFPQIFDRIRRGKSS